MALKLDFWADFCYFQPGKQEGLKGGTTRVCVHVSSLPATCPQPASSSLQQSSLFSAALEGFTLHGVNKTSFTF